MSQWASYQLLFFKCVQFLNFWICCNIALFPFFENVLGFWLQGMWNLISLARESKLYPPHWKARSQPLDFQGHPHTWYIDEHTEIWPGQTAFPGSHNLWMSNRHLNGSSLDLEYPLDLALSSLVNSHQACWLQLLGVHRLIVLTCGFLKQSQCGLHQPHRCPSFAESIPKVVP